MTKQEFTNEIARRAGLTARDAAKAVDAFLETITDTLKGGGDGELTQLEAATVDGSVFVVRQGARRIVATTSPEPTVGLVFYDLKSCLRGVEDDPEPAKPRRRTPRKKESEAEAQG